MVMVVSSRTDRTLRYQSDQGVMVFADILQEARRRVPLVNSESLPWPEEPEPIPEEAMCACGHPYEKHDSRGRCQVPKGASAFGYESLCQCEGFVLSDFCHQPAGEPSR
jgi:hypothetical protein